MTTQEKGPSVRDALRPFPLRKTAGVIASQYGDKGAIVITVDEAEALPSKDSELIAAVLEWSGDRSPNDPGDAELMKAIWRHQGPNVKPCPECDGDCGEPCAPISVEAACAQLDRFIEDWNKRHGITRIAP